MAASLRIARLTLSGLAPVNATDQDSLFSRYPALRQIIRRHLPAITASLLAEPRIASDDSIVEWYSDLSGQPVRLSDLPLSRQRDIRHRLDDRLDSLSHLADQLDAHDPDLARSLRESLHYPGDDYVYVIGDQPVLTFWGHRLADHPPAAPVNPAASAKVVDEIPPVSGLGAPVRLITRRRMGRWLFIAGGILLLLLVLCFWWCYAHKEPPPDPFADLRDRFEQAQGDCDELKLFDRSLTPEQRRHTDLQILSNELKQALETCRQQKKQDEKKLDKAMEQCPGERPEELAPDLVIVFDASGSMNQSIAPDSVSERLLRQAMQNSDDTTKAIMGVLGSVLSGTRVGQTINQAQMPKRITAAREATRHLVRTLPQDVDTGLVVLKDCPKATNMGFYKPNERQRLLMRVRSLQPERGTPLGDGILQAAKMVDGVNKPAVLIVVSDGKESCHADVCGIARRLAQQKPLLVINTVDITGTNAGDCLSSATGGRVYTANNAQEINEMIQKAAIEVTGPAHCRNAIPSP